MKLDELNNQKLFANLHILYDDLINFLESKSQVVEIKHMEDPVIGMMEHIVENADTLFFVPKLSKCMVHILNIMLIILKSKYELQGMKFAIFIPNLKQASS